MGILIKAPTRHREPGLAAVEANDATADLTGALHIREVVRITGLRREQLYMWQRRYGFPAPLRDPFGDRVYPPDQVARLKLIKQLLSEGWRAGAVVPLADSANCAVPLPVGVFTPCMKATAPPVPSSRDRSNGFANSRDWCMNRRWPDVA